MRPLQALGVYLIAVFIGGALLAPWLYWLTQSVSGPFLHLAESPFHRFVDRALLGLALIGIWPLQRSLGARSLHDLGLVKPPGHWNELGAGFLLGFASLATIAAGAVVGGARTFAPNLCQASLVWRLLPAILTAAVVAVLEEILFRGGVLRLLRKAMDWRIALVISSIVYAMVHFMQSAKLQGEVTWYSGLEILPRMLKGFATWHEVIPGFFNLTLAGLLLGYAYQRTGNLWLSIGLHGGWIFWMKSYALLTREGSHAHVWFWGTSRLVNGWFSLLVVTATLLALRTLPVIRRGVGETPAPLGPTLES